MPFGKQTQQKSQDLPQVCLSYPTFPLQILGGLFWDDPNSLSSPNKIFSSPWFTWATLTFSYGPGWWSEEKKWFPKALLLVTFFGTVTPRKINMEPKNHPNWKGKSSSKPSCSGFMLIFQGVSDPLNGFLWPPTTGGHTVTNWITCFSKFHESIDPFLWQEANSIYSTLLKMFDEWIPNRMMVWEKCSSFQINSYSSVYLC